MNLILGILTSEQNVRSPYIRSLLRTGRERGVMVFSFTPRGLTDAGARFVEGFGGAGERPKGVFPWPTVVYNRVATRKDEVSPSVERVKGALRQRGVRYFNERFFNKREVDQVLRADSETALLLPDTVSGWDAHRVSEMLTRYGSVFVKPISGSFGEGICQLTQVGGRYRLDVRGQLGTVPRFYDDRDDCLESCRAQLGGWACVIQEGIDLLTYEEAKTDFRVHVHRDARLEWKVAAIGAKVAHHSAITTHVHSGGHVEDSDSVFKAWFGEKSGEARERMESAAIRVCQRLTEQLDPSLGELGLDMGLARDGRVVLFEANSKPGRAIFSHRSLVDAARVSRDLLFAYGQALSQSRSRSDSPTEKAGKSS